MESLISKFTKITFRFTTHLTSGGLKQRKTIKGGVVDKRLRTTVPKSGVRRKFSWGSFYQWHMVVICIFCSLFVTSQFDVIFIFPNQRFGEVC